MLYLKYFFFVIIAGTSLFFSPQLAYGRSDSEVYEAISSELPLLPIPLLSESGKVAFLENNRSKGISYSLGVIVDQFGNSLRLPSAIRIKPVVGISGLYLIEHFQGRIPVVRLAKAEEGRLVVGPYLQNPQTPGSLISLPDGEVASLVGGTGNAVAMTFRVFRVEQGKLIRGTSPTQQFLEGNYATLGGVIHPVSGVPGQAFVRHKAVEIIYADGGSITLELDVGVKVFAVGHNELIVGFFNTKCPRVAGLPPGTCTPFLFKVAVPQRDMTLTRKQLSNLTPLHASTPGWTFGALDPVQEPSDLRVIGERLYVISYRGMNQTLGYFSLEEAGKGSVIIPAEQGTNLSFSLVGGDPEAPAFFVERRHLLQPISYRLVSDDEAATVFTAPAISVVAENDFSLRGLASDAAKLVSPAIMIGRSETIKNKSCGNGTALVEVHGGSGIALRPSSPAGLVPALFANNGVHTIVSLPGSGGYGIEWTLLGAYNNSSNQTRSLSQTLRILRNTGCERIVLTGFSHGGVVSMNTALLYPELVDAIVIGGAPMDLEADLQMGNQAMVDFLPQEFDFSSSSATDLSPNYWDTISPSRNLQSAQDLSGLSVTLFFGSVDNRSSTFAPPEFIAELKAKGAQVRVIERPGVGHTKWSSPQQWAEYYSILGSAIASDP
ncbi:MAG: alpha/beta fold hydrolase [Pseudomonadota bacterium]